jgi:hypothetical protein
MGDISTLAEPAVVEELISHSIYNVKASVGA